MSKLLRWFLVGGVVCFIVAAGAAFYIYATIAPTLPPVASLRDVHFQAPLRVLTQDGALIAEYGEKRREPVIIDDVPQVLRNAIVAAEDKRFYKHHGVAWEGLARAVYHLVKTGRKGPGGSTLTMQVARNFFLTKEKTYSRKLTEILLSFKIEAELTKDDILALYINKMYLGNRAYGFAAAAKVYYGKHIRDLNLQESAMLAGLLKAPSRYNPIVNPERALERRRYVLGRMHSLEMITPAEYQQALATPVSASLHLPATDVNADHIGEMVRSLVEDALGETWSTGGYQVYTTIDTVAQNAANQSLHNALFAYEKRHGYTGPAAKLDITAMTDIEQRNSALRAACNFGDMTAVLITDVTTDSASTLDRFSIAGALALTDIEWARQRIDVDSREDEITAVSDVLAVGDIICTRTDVDGNMEFIQEPEIEGAFVALNPTSGDIRALVGGFDFYRSKFNRVVQARRQPGSTLKPFIYSAALENGDTAASIYNDAPVVFFDEALEGEWRPANYSGRFFGPTTLREALVKSRNLVSIRVLRDIGVPYAIDYASRFGFDEADLPPDLSLALGNASVTPIEVATAFSVFANGGFRVTPNFISSIQTSNGITLYQRPEVVLCEDCDIGDALPTKLAMTAGNNITVTGGAENGFTEAVASVAEAPRVIESRNAYIMQSILRDVVKRGTARKARDVLDRSDLAGKTGTTNNQLDAWFSGFNQDLVATAWIGSDGLKPLGRGESGGVAALPIWVNFMKDTLEGVAITEPAEPEGMVNARIDRKTGAASSDPDGSVIEMFREEFAPEGAQTRSASNSSGSDSQQAAKPAAVRKPKEDKEAVEQLF